MTAGPSYGLIGGLAAFPRRLAARAVEATGGRLRRGTSCRTTHAVFGRTLLARWGDADLAARAETEHRAGRRLLSENGFLGFLGRLGVTEAAGSADIPRDDLLRQSQLPAGDFGMLALFDAFERDAEPFSFRDLILARKYAGLLAGGASWGAIARSVHRSGSAVSLTAKSLRIGEGRAIQARCGDRLAELDGQLLLELGPAPAAPEDADALFAAAEEAETGGRPVEAAALYGRCLVLDPDDAIAAFNRANCLASAGSAAEAEQDYIRALQRDADFVEAWFNLACLVARQGRAEAARRHLERAVRIEPDYADAVYNLAAHAWDAGDLDEARRRWTRYLELDSDSDWARSAARGLKLIALQSASAG